MAAQDAPPPAPAQTLQAELSTTRSGVRIRLPTGGDFAAVLRALDQAAGGVAVRSLAVTVDAAGRSLEPAHLREIETLILERHGAALLQVVQGLPVPAGAGRPRAASGRRRAAPRAATASLGRSGAEEAAAALAAPPDQRPAARRIGRRGPAEADGPASPGRGAAALAAAVAEAGVDRGAPALVGTELSPTLLVRRTLRSGQRIRYNGNVVVLGDVNPGAEVVASGDIVVMGTLRGVAHAGATGLSEALVVAVRLQPTQLRVGSVIGRAPDGQAPRPEGPEVARLRDGALVIERYVPAAND